jgi:peptide/nickel transport system permease protein
MLRLIASRLLSAIPVLLLVVLIAFFLMRMVPGDPTIVMGGLQSTPQERAQMAQQLGLDQPMTVQLWRWLAGLAQGDMGRSVLLGREVSAVAAERLPVTFSIAIYAFAITLVFGIAAGVVAALGHNTWVDQLLMTVAVIGVSLPNFWLALMLIVLFSVELRWLPTGGYIPFTQDAWLWLRGATLPAVALALLQVGLLARITRSTMLEVLRLDYVRTAKAKGLSHFKVVVKHAFTNTLIPVLTTVGHIFSLLIGGSIVIETVFSIPGFGLLLGSAILSRDYPVIQGGLLLFATILVALNIVIDLIYAKLDPRIRYDGSQ